MILPDNMTYAEIAKQCYADIRFSQAIIERRRAYILREARRADSYPYRKLVEISKAETGNTVLSIVQVNCKANMRKGIVFSTAISVAQSRTGMQGFTISDSSAFGDVVTQFNPHIYRRYAESKLRKLENELEQVKNELERNKFLQQLKSVEEGDV